MNVFVDADACPRSVLGIVRRYRARYGYGLITISSYQHQLTGPDHITVDDEPEAADLAIANRVGSGDVVVTQDWGLAALVLGKGAFALTPRGMVFRTESMDMLLEERALKARVRQRGGRTKGPSARTSRDDRRFREEFLNLLDEG